MGFRHNLDEQNRLILKALAEDPRMPYSDIAERLTAEGHKMSSEAVRNRVSALLDNTDIFFLLDPDKHEWEIVRLAISVSDEAGAKDEAMDRIAELPFWLVTRGIGKFDVYAVASAASNSEVDRLVTEVEELEHVTAVEYSVETGRRTTVDNYLTVDNTADRE